MTAFLLPLLAGLLRCKLCWIAVGIGAAVLLLWGYVARAEHKAAEEARAAVVAEYEQKSAEESARRQQVIAEARQQAEEAAQRAAEADRKNDELLRQVASLAAKADRVQCMDRDLAGRVRAVSRRGHQAGK